MPSSRLMRAMEEIGKNKKTTRNQLSTKKRKEAFIQALEQTMGVQTPARKMVGNLSPETVRQWREKDPEFAKAMDECKAVCGDFVESKLLQKIKDGDTTAIIFYCKTQLKGRGYSERTEITGADGGSIKVQLKTDQELDKELASLERKAKA